MNNLTAKKQSRAWLFFLCALIYCLPVFSQPTFPVDVQTLVYLVDLREIDGARQVFQADLVVRMRWKDESLINGEGPRVIPLNSAWNPGVQVVNRILVQTSLPDVLEVDRDGNVLFRQRYIGQFSARLDLKDFPLDTQVISFRLAAPGKSPKDVRFVLDPDKGGIAQEISLTDWRIDSWKGEQKNMEIAGSGVTISGFSFDVTATRLFQFFLVQIILPMTLILGMSWIVFWLDPTQTGSRVSISITSMLTLVAYRLLTGSFLPRLSFLTRMDYFVFGCTLLVFSSLLNVVWISRLLAEKKDVFASKVEFHARWIYPLLFVLMLVGCFL